MLLFYTRLWRRRVESRCPEFDVSRYANCERFARITGVKPRSISQGWSVSLWSQIDLPLYTCFWWCFMFWEKPGAECIKSSWCQIREDYGRYRQLEFDGSQSVNSRGRKNGNGAELQNVNFFTYTEQRKARKTRQV